VTTGGTDAPASRPSVLIVDDSSMMRSLLSRLVEGDRDADGNRRWRLAGTAPDGRTAITQARELCPDICLLDLEMPVLGGLDALPAIRAVCDAAVIVVSSIAAPGSAERRACLMAGAAAVVAKPSGAVSADLLETSGQAILSATRAALTPPEGT
jgi:two-component system chemotaxis response regulator CheB